MGKFERDGFSLRGGLIRLYRRGDSKSDIWHASVTRPDRKVDRFSTKTTDSVEAGRVAERHLDRLRFAEEFGIPLDQKTFRHVAEGWYAEVTASKLNKRDKANFRAILDRLRFAEEFGIPLDQKTFRHVAEGWYAEVTASKLNKRDKANFRAILDRYLLPFLGDKVISTLKARDVADYRKWRRDYWIAGPGKDVSEISYVRDGRTFTRPPRRIVPTGRTLAREDIVLRGVLKAAIALGYSNNHDLANLKSPPAEPNCRGALSREQYAKLVQTAWDRTVEIANKQTRYYRQLLAAYVQFMVMTGLRPGEARDLRFQDVKDGYVVLRSSKTKVRKVVGVAGFGRIISFLHDVHQATYGDEIDDELENPFPRPTDYLWRDYNENHPIKDFKRSFNELLAASEIRWDEHNQGRITVYSLRHTYAHFRIVYGGVSDVYLLAQNMGTSVQMIERYYGHLEPLQRMAELKRVHRNADPDKRLKDIGELFGETGSKF